MDEPSLSSNHSTSPEGANESFPQNDPSAFDFPGEPFSSSGPGWVFFLDAGSFPRRRLRTVITFPRSERGRTLPERKLELHLGKRLERCQRLDADRITKCHMPKERNRRGEDPPTPLPGTRKHHRALGTATRPEKPPPRTGTPRNLDLPPAQLHAAEYEVAEITHLH